MSPSGMSAASLLNEVLGNSSEVEHFFNGYGAECGELHFGIQHILRHFRVYKSD